MEQLKKNNEKNDIIEGLGKNPDRMIVQKCYPLYSLWGSNLDLPEFRVLDVYLSRINSHEPERRRVKFEKGEMEQLFGIERIRPETLERQLRKLMSTIVKIEDPDEDNGFCLITIFSMAECKRDKHGIWQVTLECSDAAMKYVFNIENLGYIRYAIRATRYLNSRYSYLLFLYLEKNRHMHLEWTEDLTFLKKFLRCDDDPLYDQYYRFNEKVLKRCKKEIEEKTACRFNYTPVKKGRTVIEIKFSLDTLCENVEKSTSRSLVSVDDTKGAEYTVINDDELQLSGQVGLVTEITSFQEQILATCHKEFSEEQVDEIEKILMDIPDDCIPLYNDGYNMNQRRLELLNEIYTKFCIVVKRKAKTTSPVGNRFNYFLKMLNQAGKGDRRNQTAQGPSVNAELEKAKKAKFDEDMEWLMAYKNMSNKSL